MKNIESLDQFQTIKATEQAIFIFSADWCPDCRVIEPILPEIENEFSDFQFYLVDRDQFIDLCGELDIFGIPSFLAFNQGEEIGRFVSKDRKSKEEIQAFIRNLK